MNLKNNTEKSSYKRKYQGQMIVTWVRNSIVSILLSAALMGVPAVSAQTVCDDTDIDNDDDGLIELCYLESLDAVRHVLDGTGYKSSANATTSTAGCGSGGCRGYELVRDLDFNDDDSYRDSANKTRWTTTSTGGWIPIGDNSNRFSGVFAGNGYTLSNLTIHTAANYIGLFGVLSGSGTITGTGLSDVAVHGNNEVGGLVGRSYGTISNSYSSGDVSGAYQVGGLVGYTQDGTITNSYATGDVSGRNMAGGLVGANVGTITNSSATAAVLVEEIHAGGLVAFNKGQITNSYAAGVAEGRSLTGGLVGYNYKGAMVMNSYAAGNALGDTSVGGLVGANAGKITSSYAIGNKQNYQVIVRLRGGGLVGHNMNGAIVINSYAAANVLGTNQVIANRDHLSIERLGGLVGSNEGVITNSFAAGHLIFGKQVGGLVGINRGKITNSYATGDLVTCQGFCGGFVGRNENEIKNCYAIGGVSISRFLLRIGIENINFGDDDTPIIVGSDRYAVSGGLVGINASNAKISNCYAHVDITIPQSGNYDTLSSVVAGFAGENHGQVTSSYWRRSDRIDAIFVSVAQTTGNSEGIKPLSSEQLARPVAPTATTYSGWSAADWDFGTTQQYAVLKSALGPDTGNPACGSPASLPRCGTLLPGQRVLKSFSLTGTAMAQVVDPSEQVVRFNEPFLKALNYRATIITDITTKVTRSIRREKTTKVINITTNVMGVTTDVSVTTSVISVTTNVINVRIHNETTAVVKVETYTVNRFIRVFRVDTQANRATLVHEVRSSTGGEFAVSQLKSGNRIVVRVEPEPGLVIDYPVDLTLRGGDIFPRKVKGINLPKAQEGERYRYQIPEDAYVYPGESNITYELLEGPWWLRMTKTAGQHVLESTGVLTAAEVPANMAGEVVKIRIVDTKGSLFGNTRSETVVLLLQVSGKFSGSLTIVSSTTGVLQAVGKDVRDSNGVLFEEYRWEKARTGETDFTEIGVPGFRFSLVTVLPAQKNAFRPDWRDRRIGTRYRITITFTDIIGEQSTLGAVYTITEAFPMPLRGLDGLGTSYRVHEGDRLTLDGTARTLNQSPLNYFWQQKTDGKNLFIESGLSPASTSNKIVVIEKIPSDYIENKESTPTDVETENKGSTPTDVETENKGSTPTDVETENKESASTVEIVLTVSDGTAQSTASVVVTIIQKNNGNIASPNATLGPPEFTKEENKLSVPSFNFSDDPDGGINQSVGISYLWQRSTDNQVSWHDAPGDNTGIDYIIPPNPPEGALYRARISYQDNQHYRETVYTGPSIFSVFFRIKLFLEGALQ